MIKYLFSTLFLLGCFMQISCSQATQTSQNKVNTSDKHLTINMEGLELATLAGGCFWCVEAMYQDLKGVKKVESGYAGGHVKNPTYKEVCSGRTGHAEVIQITFDPNEISFKELLDIFWYAHDPTTLNRQGADVGTQYRSAIFYHSEAQKQAAEASMAEANASGDFERPIVTEITAYKNYTAAEDYHQDYYNINGKSNGYCSVVISPKLAKFRKKYKSKLKDELKN